MPTEVLGLEAIKRGLNSLPVKMQQNVLRAGNRAVANEVAAVARRQIAVPIGIRAAITVERDRSRQTTRGMKIGVGRRRGRLAHLFEFGTAMRFHKSGKFVGRIAATPFLRPALEAVGPRAATIWAKASGRNMRLQFKKLGLGG